MIISPRKLLKMARNWQRLAAIGQERSSFSRKVEEVCCTSNDHSLELAEKGRFVVYTTDRRRFTFPIAYLNSLIFRELFRMSEEEFGLPNNGPIILPCDSVFLVYVNSLLQKKAARDVEKALLMSMATCRCKSSYNYLHHQETGQHVLLI